MKIALKHTIASTCQDCRLKKVAKALEKVGLHCAAIDIESAVIADEISIEQKDQLSRDLTACGIELVFESNAVFVAKVKRLLEDYVEPQDHILRIRRLSDYLSGQMHQHYSRLSHQFSQLEGITIEHSFLNLRIARVKEYLSFGNLTLTEIAYRLNYSSVAHLSRQFKELTGSTASEFKHLAASRSIELNNCSAMQQSATIV